MNRSVATVLAVSILSFAACDAGPDAGQPGSEPPKPGASSAAAPAAAISDGDLAVQADFDEEAETSITAANYKAEADTLEKELAD